MIICSPQLGLSPKSVLGGEVFDREILLGLARKGVKIEVILPSALKHDVGKNNINFTNIPFSHFPAVFFNILIIPYLFKLNKKRMIDIIRLHQPQFVGIGAILFKIFHPKVKIVATYHQYHETKFSTFTKIINNYWDFIICDSDVVKKKLIRDLGLSDKKIEVVHNGVPNYLHPNKKDKSLIKKYNLEDKKILLFMGLFIKRKNPLFLLNLVKSISKTIPNITLIYWGKGPLKKSIVQRARELGISKNVRFIEPLFGSAKNKIHSLADVFVHPSLEEGFALAPLEAMACGKVVIMNECHSAREAIKDGYNGFLCEPNDILSWGRNVEKLLMDINYRKKLGSNGRKRAIKEFNWQMSVQKHYDVFQKLINPSLNKS